MLKNQKKKTRYTTILLSEQDRDDLQELRRLKYHDMEGVGLTTILRKEGMESVRRQIAELKKAHV